MQFEQEPAAPSEARVGKFSLCIARRAYISLLFGSLTSDVAHLPSCARFTGCNKGIGNLSGIAEGAGGLGCGGRDLPALTICARTAPSGGVLRGGAVHARVGGHVCELAQAAVVAGCRASNVLNVAAGRSADLAGDSNGGEFGNRALRTFLGGFGRHRYGVVVLVARSTDVAGRAPGVAVAVSWTAFT